MSPKKETGGTKHHPPTRLRGFHGNMGSAFAAPMRHHPFPTPIAPAAQHTGLTPRQKLKPPRGVDESAGNGCAFRVGNWDVHFLPGCRAFVRGDASVAGSLQEPTAAEQGVEGPGGYRGTEIIDSQPTKSNTHLLSHAYARRSPRFYVSTLLASGIPTIGIPQAEMRNIRVQRSTNQPYYLCMIILPQ